MGGLGCPTSPSLPAMLNWVSERISTAVTTSSSSGASAELLMVASEAVELAHAALRIRQQVGTQLDQQYRQG